MVGRLLRLSLALLACGVLTAANAAATDRRGEAPKPDQPADRGNPRVAALATALARAVATGTDFG